MPERKVLLITGASSGIGAATAHRAVEEGYDVALAARSKEKLSNLVDALGKTHALAITCDVTDQQDQRRMVAETLERFGRIDALFANAGMGGTSGGFSGANPDVWQSMILTNVYGVALSIQAALPALREQRGHVLLTGSAAGRTTIPGSMYSATKWAVGGIGYNLREELRGSGMRVTLIEPGRVDTPFFDEPPKDAMKDIDIANAVIYALQQPAHVDVNEMLIRPTPPIE
ncbi:SDR family oxidoreductase [Salinicola rhizosphaerae]|uniref:Short-chain dehydrogenase n=1 Tax=Salinicola rhizosphaerae TaxID=1443141 RepID=A0ABQ3DYC9_9GAMM|nr:SDR family oxidoreductase [Salinicola rhizosphaerae]GHB17696.1 short-chain dehydrogenase [Salinicola rhizosphaerae]